MDYADEPLRKMGEEVILKALEELKMKNEDSYYCKT